MDKRFWGFLIAIGLVLAGIFFITNTNKADAPAASRGVLTNHVRGQGTTGVTLVEYGDFQCPACGQYYAPLEDVVKKYGDQIKFQFRHFPIVSAHPNAIAGGRAAEAADMQGKFWEMHSKLFQENYTQQVARSQGKDYPTWTEDPNVQDVFVGYAKELGLDTAKFSTDFKSSTANNRVQADLAEGNKLGVNSTPTFFVNGKKISTPQPTLEAFSKIIDAEIAKKGGNKTPATAPAATPPAAEPAPAPAATE
ncbi:MAG TPA: thioredoxin domain-containing protein [Candidatus Saccharimonadales bacterium]|jgi:protein-disulfide isomerase